MGKLELKLKDFMAIQKADLSASNNLIVLISPNRAGKSQILYLLYSIYFELYRAGIEEREFNCKSLMSKLKSVFLVSKSHELVRWGAKFSQIDVKLDGWQLHISIKDDGKYDCVSKGKIPELTMPVFYYPGGFGDYYKSIFSVKKYYPKWQIVSDAISDFIYDILMSNGQDVPAKYKSLLDKFEELFNVKYFVQNQRIFVREGEKLYKVERAASGLKSLSGLYLMIKQRVLDRVLFLDEPETSLHPEYITKLVEFLYSMSQEGIRIFIATHSDYLIQALKVFVMNRGFRVNVWEGSMEDIGRAVFNSYEANEDNPIDASPLTDIYLKLVRDTYAKD